MGGGYLPAVSAMGLPSVWAFAAWIQLVQGVGVPLDDCQDCSLNVLQMKASKSSKEAWGEHGYCHGPRGDRWCDAYSEHECRDRRDKGCEWRQAEEVRHMKRGACNPTGVQVHKSCSGDQGLCSSIPGCFWTPGMSIEPIGSPGFGRNDFNNPMAGMCTGMPMYNQEVNCMGLSEGLCRSHVGQCSWDEFTS
ncbi:unnamed protein product [Durusdinium trenchii]|uniref:Uncharacterized protein n=1 Tax=Durusdinium trenchii TaxID=1381693 RepID=A0ABP0RXI2_9DINO